AAGEDREAIAQPSVIRPATRRQKPTADEVELEAGVEYAPGRLRRREGPLRRSRDARREEGLVQDTDRARREGHGAVEGHPVTQVVAETETSKRGARVRAAEEQSGPALLHRNVDAEAGCVLVLEEPDDVAVQVDDGDRHAGR